MTLEQVGDLLKKTGIPVAYRSFQQEEAPRLPVICYQEMGSNNFAADGTVYQKITRIQVELYTTWKDTKTEEKVEQELNDFAWEKTETYIKSERCYQILYEIEI